ncbi:MAG: hypothetical protein K9G59_04315 [Caulobacter sp.]|nr:hypothetical protein [Caulobacter sp.]
MILALNIGSASFKFALYADDEALTRILAGAVATDHGETRLSIDPGRGRPAVEANVEGAATEPGRIVPQVLDHLRRLGFTDGVTAVGHRIVHGGTAFAAPTRLDQGVLEALAALAPLAPAHQPAGLAGVAAAAVALPGAVQVGCFDTAFHADQPRLTRLYGLPCKLTEQGIRLPLPRPVLRLHRLGPAAALRRRRGRSRHRRPPGQRRQSLRDGWRP